MKPYKSFSGNPSDPLNPSVNSADGNGQTIIPNVLDSTQPAFLGNSNDFHDGDLGEEMEIKLDEEIGPLNSTQSPHAATLEANRAKCATPPLPAIMHVKNLSHNPSPAITQPKIPEIDQTRVDAIGTLNKPPALEVNFVTDGTVSPVPGARRVGSPVDLSSYAANSPNNQRNKHAYWKQRNLIPVIDTNLSRSNPQKYRITSPIPSSSYRVPLPPRPRTASPTGIMNRGTIGQGYLSNPRLNIPVNPSGPNLVASRIHKPQAKRKGYQPSSMQVDQRSNVVHHVGAPMELIRNCPKSPRRCNCKNSKCLKLYCECFASRRYCMNCNCIGCENTIENKDEVETAAAITLERNPSAFKAKITIGKHTRGCHCRKSSCLKKYCECYQAGILCGDNCKCLSCKNFAGSEDLKRSLESRRLSPVRRRQRNSRKEIKPYPNMQGAFQDVRAMANPMPMHNPLQLDPRSVKSMRAISPNSVYLNTSSAMTSLNPYRPPLDATNLAHNGHHRLSSMRPPIGSVQSSFAGVGSAFQTTGSAFSGPVTKKRRMQPPTQNIAKKPS